MDVTSLNTLFQSSTNPWLLAQGMREADTNEQQQLANLYKTQQDTYAAGQRLPLELDQTRANIGHTTATTGYQNQLTRQLTDQNNMRESVPIEQRIADHLVETHSKRSAADQQLLDNSFKMIPGYLAKAAANGGRLSPEDLKYVSENYKTILPFLQDPQKGAAAYRGYQLYGDRLTAQNAKQDWQGNENDANRQAALERARLLAAARGGAGKAGGAKDFKMSSEQTMNYYRKLASETPDPTLKAQYESMADRAELQMLRAIKTGADAKQAGAVDIATSTKGRVAVKPPADISPTPQQGKTAPKVPALPPGFKLD